jgi:PEP-CTERM motif
MMMKNALILTALLVAGNANADVLTQWNFNSVPVDGSTSTGSLVPSIGSGGVSTLNVTPSFASGSANGGSSDPATVDDTGLGITGFAAQGADNKLRGLQFNVSTLGFEDIVISYDLRHSNTSSRYEQFQYSLDGTSFTDFALFDGNAGDTWFNNRTVDLSSITGADNNASFAFRVVSAFAPSTSQYAASNITSNYATTGTWRFDMATVSGTAIAPIPEPETYAMLLAGLALIGFSTRRKQ